MANILLVDDERSIRDMLEIAFRKEGHRVESAGSAATALEKGTGIVPDSLPERVFKGPAISLDRVGPLEFPEDGLDLQHQVEVIERSLMEAALDRSHGVRTRAAELLRMSYRSFRHYAKKHGL